MTSGHMRRQNWLFPTQKAGFKCKPSHESIYVISADVCYIKKQWVMCTALQILSGREASYENANRNHSLKCMLPEAFSKHTQPLTFLLQTHT